jgi:hypothetical protein
MPYALQGVAPSYLLGHWWFGEGALKGKLRVVGVLAVGRFAKRVHAGAGAGSWKNNDPVRQCSRVASWA